MPFTSWKTTWKLKWYRVAKYKQRRQLKTRDYLATLQNIQIGACTGLSYWWIQRHRQNPDESPALRVQSLNSDAAFANHDYLAGVFNSTGGGYPNRIRRVAEAALRSGGAAPVAEEQDLTTFRTTMTHLTANPGHQVLLMHITNYATSHVCAFWAGPDYMRFFDPNLGEFKVSNGNRAAFFAHLVAQYETYVDSAGTPTVLEFDTWYFGCVA